jgi:hypothetical protein
MNKTMKTLLKALPKGEQTTPRERGTVLEPCPFCGSKGFLGAEATYSHNLKPYEMDYAIRCGSCDALGPWGATAYIAATLWNKRETARNAHKGRSSVAAITAASCLLLAFLAPLQADDRSAFPRADSYADGKTFWLYNSKIEPWLGDPIIGRDSHGNYIRQKRAAQIVDDNPGVIDDQACRGLVVAQLKSQNQQLKDWIVEYHHASIYADGMGGANVYHATSRVTGEVWEIIVALHSEQVKTK